jgi:transcription-repair coupling factor (superfamily II helicase)
MKLFQLTSIIENSPAFQGLINRLKRPAGDKVQLQAPEPAYCCLAAAIHHRAGSPLLLVMAHPEIARRRLEEVAQWMPGEATPVYFPELDLLGRPGESDPVVQTERLKVLSLLSLRAGSRLTDDATPLLITNAIALAGKCPVEEDFKAGHIEIIQGMEIAPALLLNKLQAAGYEYDQVVEIPGTFARRGGIIDIYAGDGEYPVRIEFFGDQVDNLRTFDPKTQRSGHKVPSVLIPPFRSFASSGQTSLLDYLPDEAIILAEDFQQLEAEVEKIEREYERPDTADFDKSDAGVLPFLTWRQVNEKLAGFKPVIELMPWNAGDAEGALPIKAAPSFALNLPAFLDHAGALRRDTKRLIVVSQQVDRLREMLSEKGMEAEVIESLSRAPVEGSLTLLRGSLDGGWQLGNDLLLLTDVELFGIIKQRRTLKLRPVRHHRFLNDINTGDYVVHIEHGIGRFAGVKKMAVDSVDREYFVLEYAAGDILYTPVEQVDRISLYLGSGDLTPSLSRLGTQEWDRTRRKVKESVADIAGELIEVYAAREASRGHAFTSDTLWQQELEASFPYVETIDQLDAVRAVKIDMEAVKPMDRLVCGDVGYGKTEIAVRAAFKAVMDNRQVAVLVPTTILAQQHITTFSERLRAFPVKTAVLSRFCSAREQAEIVDALKDGSIDICIGTHRLLQKDVVFKDLGLVIIDEEQRFGVVHKEHFKKMRQSVDVLTLSATPIPRTLHMSLSGIRDMSTIETPPENRLPVNTYIGEFNAKMVREAILREMERDGQVFVVHNRVNSIGMIAQKIKEIVPEAKIAVAHGRLDEDDLEEVMARFQSGESDVLVTTTIIESGLDIPNVNTLIVNAADKLGLTQLYQLRGRVGRGANTAYAYFLFDSGKELTDQARERLKTIAQATELGAGFAIAMKDLEIRGAGNLLGVEQSGHIAAVGFSYYCQLLSEAVEELKAKREGRVEEHVAEQPSVTIDLRIPALIPEEYIDNMRTRFNFYQRLARLDDHARVDDIAREMLDRFGDPPVEVSNLLYIAGVRQLASHRGIESISRQGDQITIAFRDDVDTQALFSRMKHRPGIMPGNVQVRIEIVKLKVDWRKALKGLLEDLPTRAD